MIDLTSEVHITRLYNSIVSARNGMKPFRENRTLMLKEYVGRNYNGNGSDHEVIVNLIAQTADVYTIGLASNNPKVTVTTNNRNLLSFAERFRVGINNQIKEMRFSETLQNIVLDSLFGIGISKTHLAATEPIQLEDDIWADVGQLHVSRISIDDFVMDLSAKKKFVAANLWLMNIGCLGKTVKTTKVLKNPFWIKCRLLLSTTEANRKQMIFRLGTLQMMMNTSQWLTL